MRTAAEKLAPSFLDRLLEAATADGQRGAQAGMVSALDVKEMISVIGRDLEDLLNTRATHQGLVDPESDLTNTIITFGLTDIGSLELCGGKQRERMAEAVAHAIRIHEPRLRDVRVLIPDPFSLKERTLRLLVEGRLQVDPATWVAFEARLARGTGEYTVQSTPA